MEVSGAFKGDLKKVLRGECQPGDIGIRSQTVLFVSLSEISLESLKMEQYRQSIYCASANSAGFHTLEKTSSSCLEHIAVLAKRFHNHTLTPIVSSIDIAECALTLVEEVARSRVVNRLVKEVEDNSDSDGSRSKDGVGEERESSEKQIMVTGLWRQWRSRVEVRALRW